MKCKMFCCTLPDHLILTSHSIYVSFVLLNVGSTQFDPMTSTFGMVLKLFRHTETTNWIRHSNDCQNFIVLPNVMLNETSDCQTEFMNLYLVDFFGILRNFCKIINVAYNYSTIPTSIFLKLHHFVTKMATFTIVGYVVFSNTYLMNICCIW